jgi:hypothetical protein
MKEFDQMEFNKDVVKDLRFLLNRSQTTLAFVITLYIVLTIFVATAAWPR